MKKLLSLMLVLLLVVCVGCGQEPNEPQGQAETLFGYIDGWQRTDTGYTIDFDKAEWLTAENDADRLVELGLDPDNLDDGYYINNPEEETVSYALAEDVKITLLSFMDWSEMEVDEDGFAEYYEEYLQDVRLPFWVTLSDGAVTEIRMQYIP